MLEWKARIFTMLISLAAILDQLWVQIDNNWNW
jgi:hypothetical protein